MSLGSQTIRYWIFILSLGSSSKTYYSRFPKAVFVFLFIIQLLDESSWNREPFTQESFISINPLFQGPGVSSVNRFVLHGILFIFDSQSHGAVNGISQTHGLVIEKKGNSISSIEAVIRPLRKRETTDDSLLKKNYSGFTAHLLFPLIGYQR